MAQKMLIDATHAEETRVVVVDGHKVEEFDFETASRRQLAGNIYLAKVTRVEPSLQAAFVDYGGNRHGFLAFAEIHPDYYQIPAADRAALLEEERALAREGDDDDEKPARQASGGAAGRKPRRSSNRRKPAAQPERAETADAVETRDVAGMEVLDLSEPEDTIDLITDGTDAAPQDVAAKLDADETADTDTVAEDARAQDAEKPYVAADHATDLDDRIESISEGGDAADEMQPRRKPRLRRYKIQEVIRVRQIMLVQVVKEERGNKGAALTTYLSLAGRYCVLMPNTARGGGISRKITNAADRQKLKAIAAEIEVPEGAGLIVRTAGANRTKAEIKRDYEYLFRLWEQIRELTLKSIAPTPIYEEGSLIKRSIRDLYNKNIDEVLVEGEAGYRMAKDFMKMIMPSHAKNVKPYSDAMPLFARYQVETTLGAMFNPTVQLPSGGYIVIGITEALVAIDINSGRATREGSIEDTALKTNLEAATEIARQLRLRDLAGLIVIDFIDMEERKNNAAVEKRLKDALKNDRARIQVGRISGFGLLEMSRQRLRPGMLEATTQPCPHCHGTGLIRSDDSMALTVLRQIEEEATRGRSREVLVRAPTAVVNFLFNMKREHIAQIEARSGMSIRLEADPAMISPDFTLEKFKVATRVPVVPVVSAAVSHDASLMADLEVEDEDEDLTEDEPEAEATDAETPAEAPAAGNGDDQPRKKRRRRRRRRGGARDNGTDSAEGDNADQGGDDDGSADDDDTAEPVADAPEEAPSAVAEAAPEDAPKPKRTRRSRRVQPAPEDVAAESVADAAPAPETPEEPAPKPKAKRAPRRRKAAEPAEATAEAAVVEPAEAPEAVTTADGAQAPAEPELGPKVTAQSEATAPSDMVTDAPVPEPVADIPAPEPAAEPEVAAQAEQAPQEPAIPKAPAEPAPEPAQPAGPRRSGWWAKRT